MIPICVPFTKDFIHNDEVSQFTVKYNSDTDDFMNLVKFISSYPNHRINIELIAPNEDAFLLSALMKFHHNVYFLLNSAYVEKVDEFTAAGLKFFFDLPATNWDILHSLVKSGVSDVYVSGDLGFCMNQVKRVCDDNDVQIRLMLGLAQQADPMGTSDSLVSFYIRPEDVDMYAEYADVFELFLTDRHPSVMPVLYSIFVTDKLWFGDLSEIIVGLETSLDSRTLLETFGLYRLNCKKRCYKGSNCEICYRERELSLIMLEKDILFSQEDEGEENGD